MAAPRNALSLWSQYLGARVAAAALTSFNVDANLTTAGWLGRLLHRLDGRHRGRTAAHLRVAFPDWPADRIEALTVASFEHLMQLVVEVLHTPRLLHRESWPGRITLRDLGPALEILNAGRPAIMVTGHVGNWEVLGSLLAVLGYPVDAIARPLDNRLINDWLLGIRERRGVRIITKFSATDRMLEVLGAGGTLGFIADQNAGDKGMFVPFFGKLASTYKSIGLLAMDQNVPILCGYAHRVGQGFDYEVGITDIIRPEDWQGRRDPLYYVTARYMRALETMVRRRPQQYLWMHRRWKSRPRHERQGKPMPEALRRHLEELPWMTPEQMRELERPLPREILDKR